MSVALYWHTSIRELAREAIKGLHENVSWKEIEERIRAISERKNKVKSLLEDKRYLLGTLMECAPDRIYFKDSEGRFVRNNRAHLTRLGLSDPADAKGKTDFDFFPREHAELALEDERQAMASGRLIDREERIAWPDGRVEWTQAEKMPLRDVNGEIIGTFGISRDITARKQAEEGLKRTLMELKRSNAELEQFVYAAHANCYIRKPVDFKQFEQVIAVIEQFWFETVILPEAKPYIL